MKGIRQRRWCINTCMYVHTHVCIYVWTEYIYTHTYMYIWFVFVGCGDPPEKVSVCIYICNTTHASMHLYICMNACIHMYVPTHVCMCICVFLCMCVCTHTYVYLYWVCLRMHVGIWLHNVWKLYACRNMIMWACTRRAVFYTHARQTDRRKTDR